MNKKAIKKILTIMVNRGDFDDIKEAWEVHKEDFKELNNIMMEDPMEAEELFTSIFGLEPDFFFELLY